MWWLLSQCLRLCLRASLDGDVCIHYLGAFVFEPMQRTTGRDAKPHDPEAAPPETLLPIYSPTGTKQLSYAHEHAKKKKVQGAAWGKSTSERGLGEGQTSCG